MDNMNSLPQLEPYDLEVVKEIQDMANSQFLDFLLALDNLAGEDTPYSMKPHNNTKTCARNFQIHFLKISTGFNSMGTSQELWKIVSIHWNK